MKKRFCGMLCMLFALSLCGCGKKDLGDSYIEGSDFQYMFDTQQNTSQYIARGENGYFFLVDHYIYYLDDETQQITALCNKADCLHDGETDVDRLTDCNAYVEDASSIYYCNGYLYVVDNKFDVGVDASVLYRITEDGAVKDLVYQWEQESVEQWMIHRDVMYYINHTYTVTEEDEVVEEYEIQKLALTGVRKKEPQTIMEEPEGITVYFYGMPQAYGNYLYVNITGVTVSEEESAKLTSETVKDCAYGKVFIYHILTGEISEIEIEQDDPEYSHVSRITFWQDKIVYPLSNWDDVDSIDVYIADLDGSNREKLLTEKKTGLYYYSDGVYLYETNWANVARGYEDGQYYNVYDADMNLVDTFAPPGEGGFIEGIGTTDGMYFWTVSGDDTHLRTLQYFDKSVIGTLDGAVFPYEEIATVKVATWFGDSTEE